MRVFSFIAHHFYHAQLAQPVILILWLFLFFAVHDVLYLFILCQCLSHRSGLFQSFYDDELLCC